jgi:hypothetical protein
MKLSAFNPIVITKNPESVIALFEDLGFEVRHNKTGDDELAFSTVRMKDANGFHVDIFATPAADLPQDLVAIRINVDNFDEGYNFFVGKGFTEVEGFGIRTTDSSKYAILASPTGVLVDVIEHIKK